MMSRPKVLKEETKRVGFHLELSDLAKIEALRMGRKILLSAMFREAIKDYLDKKYSFNGITTA